MADKSKLLELANFVWEQQDEYFDMGILDGCLVGYAHRLWPQLDVSSIEVGEYLGLSCQERRHLFFGQPAPGSMLQDFNDLERHEVVDVVRNFANTGLIDYGKPVVGLND